jgi:thiopurine S-methyltransferase
MEPEFWRQKWRDKVIGFHLNEANPFLRKHFAQLDLQPAQRIFVPLCGKTLDIHWLLQQGYAVAGVELSEIAVSELFAELGLEPVIHDLGALKHYQAPQLDIFEGNLFDLTTALLGAVHAVYDRAALVALPAETRARYAAHLQALCPAVPHLLLTFDYEQRLRQGPPFAVPAVELEQIYWPAYRFTELETRMFEGFQQNIPVRETVWLLR